MEIGEYFMIQLLVWSTNFSQKRKKPRPFPAKVDMGRAGLGLKLVSKVVFWAFFEGSLLITMEPHMGHTKFPDFYTLS